jgi:peptidoglycan/LPS O-acetylase OafA/YrhL
MPSPVSPTALMPKLRVPALDGLRGIAIIWVVLHNTTDLVYTAPHGPLHVLAVLSHAGWIGVQAFFALSGFLITAGLLDSRGANNYFSGFFARRALRILPLYYFVLLTLLVLLPSILNPPAPFSSSHQWPLWFFVSNWVQDVPYGFGHFWSLAVEEQFYLAWPFAVYWLAPRPLLRVCVWIALGALLLRIVLRMHGAGEWTLYSITPARMDALALGAAGACLVRIPHLVEWIRPRTKYVGALAAALFVAGALATHFFDRRAWSGQTVGYSVLALCAATLVTLKAIPGLRKGSRFSLLAWGPLRSVGWYSYAIYIFHQLLHKLVGEPWLRARYGETLSFGTAFLYAMIVLLVSYLLGYCSYQLLEKRFLVLKPPVNWSRRSVVR